MSTVHTELVAHTAETAFGTMNYLGPAGRTSDEVMLMLHGFGSNATVWWALLAAGNSAGYFAGRDIIAPDLPGFGKSENRLGHLQAKVVGRELLDIVHRLGYTKVRVAGHSMGGFLTLDMAAQYGSEITSIHIVSGAYFTILAMVQRPVATTLRSPLIGGFYALQLWLSYHDGVSGWINHVFARRPSARAGYKPHYLLGGAAFRYGAANGIGYDADKIWGGITVPVFGAFGSQDRLVTPADMRRLGRDIPAAKLTLIAGAGHSSLVEKPAEAARALFTELPRATT